MKNAIITYSIAALELLLFIVAFIVPSAKASAALIVGLSFLYYSAAKKGIYEESETVSESIKKNFSLPAILLILYLMSPEPLLKLPIIAFSAQATLRIMYVVMAREIRGSAKNKSSGKAVIS